MHTYIMGSHFSFKSGSISVYVFWTWLHGITNSFTGSIHGMWNNISVNQTCYSMIIINGKLATHLHLHHSVINTDQVHQGEKQVNLIFSQSEWWNCHPTYNMHVFVVFDKIDKWHGKSCISNIIPFGYINIKKKIIFQDV